MPFFTRLLQALGLISEDPLNREFTLDSDLSELLYDLADMEQRPVDEVASDLIHEALNERRAAADIVRTWRHLTPRQQQITALVCLGYTNQQIASRLNISPETVKSHTRMVLNRFGLRSKANLSRLLYNWDFSAWDQ
jgi:DNA-binding CsgD family transcriptional regulator